MENVRRDVLASVIAVCKQGWITEIYTPFYDQPSTFGMYLDLPDEIHQRFLTNATHFSSGIVQMVKNQIQNRSSVRRREVHFVRRIRRINECNCLKHANHFLAATGRYRCDFHHHIANESHFVKLFNRTIQHTFAMHHHAQRAARIHISQHSLLSRQQLLCWRLTQ